MASEANTLTAWGQANTPHPGVHKRSVRIRGGGVAPTDAREKAATARQWVRKGLERQQA